MKKHLLALLFLFFTQFGFCSDLSVSVIIPCHYLHVPLLKPLLIQLSNQTVLPKDVIIAISEVGNVSPGQITDLSQSQWPFDLKITTSYQKKYAGANRNAACWQAAGDIFIFQDADDVPHPQRIEVIKYYFDHYGIDHLIHCWLGEGQTFTKQRYDAENIKIYKIRKREDVLYKDLRVHFGECAISRRVFQIMQWSEKKFVGEDSQFCFDVIKTFRNTLLIDAELLIYVTSGIPGLIERGKL